MRRNIILTAACAAAIMPVTCTVDARPELTVERADSAGIELVTTAGADRELEWRIEEVVAIDSESAEAGVFEPTSTAVAADEAGRVYALDRRGGRVVVFDAGGRFVHSLGGRGGGPGEFALALALVVAPDGRAAVYDGAKQRLVWFDRDGSILPERELGEPFFGGRMVQTDAGLLGRPVTPVLPLWPAARAARHRRPASAPQCCAS